MLALAANLASVVMLMRYKVADANVRSVWLCSRNDAIPLPAKFTLGGFAPISGIPAPLSTSLMRT